MQTCAKCGTNNREGVLFCGGCGTKFVPEKKGFGKYIVMGVALLLVVAAGGYFMFANGSSKSSQTALISASNITPSTGEARNVSSPTSTPVAPTTVKASSTCPDVVNLADNAGGILMNGETPCITFTMNDGQVSPWVQVAQDHPYRTVSNDGHSYRISFSNGASYELTEKHIVKLTAGNYTFQIQAQENNQVFTVTLN